MNKYTFIFEIACRDYSGKILPREYRKKTGMSIKDARVYARCVSNMERVIFVKFFKEMF
jgi:hypothetical protein